MVERAGGCGAPGRRQSSRLHTGTGERLDVVRAASVPIQDTKRKDVPGSVHGGWHGGPHPSLAGTGPTAARTGRNENGLSLGWHGVAGENSGPAAPSDLAGFPGAPYVSTVFGAVFARLPCQPAAGVAGAKTLKVLLNRQPRIFSYDKYVDVPSARAYDSRGD